MAGRPGRTPPQPSAPARKGKSVARRTAAPTILRRVFARPGVIVAGATFAAVMTGIVANALILQKGHHPSPLFSPPPAETAPAPAQVPVPVPRQALAQPAAAPEAPPPSAAPVAEDAPAASSPAPTAKAPPHAAKKPAPTHTAPLHKDAAPPAHKTAASPHKDPIAQLLGKGQ